MALCNRRVRRCCGVLLGLFTITTIVTASVDVVLLDTYAVTSGSLNWTTHVNEADPPDRANTGWDELSFDDNGKPVRVYASCFVENREVDNWLRTPFIKVGPAQSLHVEITFTMRKCNNFDSPGSIIQCKETFNLYYYQAERDMANAQMPSWSYPTWKSVDKIAADDLYESSSYPVLNKEVRFVPLEQNLKGIYFAFQDTGACVTLVRIRVYYKACPDFIDNKAFFGQTPTGKEQTSSVKKTGVCVENSVSDPANPPRYVCMSDGTWDLPQGGCLCRGGHEGTEDSNCTMCKRQYFKWSRGNGECLSCPSHSYSDAPGSSMCLCLNNYYRADTDPKSAPCTRPPSEPLDLRKTQVSDTSVTLTWNPPADSGGRTDITYRIECPNCAQSVTVHPKRRGFNTTSATLSHLTPSREYRIFIYAENGVSVRSGKFAYADIPIHTAMSFPRITNLHAISIGDTHIAIRWQLQGETSLPVSRFTVLHYVQGQDTLTPPNYTTATNFTFQHLLRETEYVFQVKAETPSGEGEYSEPLYVRTGSKIITTTKIPAQGTPKKEAAPMPSIAIIIGAIVAVILCMAIAATMIFLLRRHRLSNDVKSAACDNHYHHVIQCPPLEPHHINGSMTAPLFQPAGSIKSYVDPHTYEDPNQAVREFTREIDVAHITIESVIGGGEFGDVCKGKLRIPARPEMTVAIKTLKAGATDKNRLDFLTEASIMGQFDDPNVIFLEGVVTKSHPIMIVTEYMANGSLDTFLKKNDGQFTVIQLVGMMRGIASGMRYLAEMGYVHRDLAARNILVNETLVCKVADFGLSREVDIDTTDGAYTTKGGKIPVRWTAPEAIAFRKFTSASDVWSYGVVMWEVISYGERPYWNWSNQDVIKAVEKGYRLPPPMDCPEAIHQLMLDTWQKERNNRPKFLTIVKTLDKLIRAPELLRKMAKPRPQQFADSTPPDMTNFGTVEEWLLAIKMERYIDNFIRAGFTSMDQVVRITIKDLDTLQITLLGHQKKIMNSVQTLRAQLLGPQMHLPQMSEGFLV